MKEVITMDILINVKDDSISDDKNFTLITSTCEGTFIQGNWNEVLHAGESAVEIWENAMKALNGCYIEYVECTMDELLIRYAEEERARINGL